MKFFVLMTAILVLFSACSSGEGNRTLTNGTNSAEVNVNSANANRAAATNSGPNGMQPYNGMQNVNPNAFNSSNDNVKIVKAVPRKDEIPYGSRIAPDDSIISSGSRGRDFFEMRTFKNHPVLAKVEKIMDGKTTKYKVYLKNGKVLDAPEDKMSNYAALAPQNILDIVGQLPKPQTKPEVKKDEKQQ